MKKERFLSAKWNNALSITLGLPTLVLGVLGFSSPLFTEFWDFIGMVILGAFY